MTPALPCILTDERKCTVPEKVQHEYECTAMGHEGSSRTFQAAPPEWFIEKSITPPKNCPECRKWIKAQVDEKSACVSCRNPIRIPATLKISRFKKVGPYVPITECNKCQDGDRPPKGTKKRPSKKDREEEEKEKNPDNFRDLLHGLSPQPRTLMKDGSYYATIITNYKTGESESRGAHIEHHIPGSVNDWTTRSVANDKGLREPASVSIFASGDTLDSLIASAQSYLSQTGENVREYRIGSKRIIRVTFTGDHDGLELTFLDETSNGIGLVSTYDNVTVAYVARQTWYNRS